MIGNFKLVRSRVVKFARAPIFALKVLSSKNLTFRNKYLYFYFIFINWVEVFLVRIHLVRRFDMSNFTSSLEGFKRELVSVRNISEIEIVNYEAFFSIQGVLNKFVFGISEFLEIECPLVKISPFPSGKSRNVFHVFFRFALPLSNVKNVALITHIDSRAKLRQIDWLATEGFSFICFSAQTADYLRSHFGSDTVLMNFSIEYFDLPSFYTGPIRKLNIGYFTNIYKDGRKRQDLFLESLRDLNPRDIKLSLMGSGLDDLVTAIKKLDFELSYIDHFDTDFYSSQLSVLDLLVYTGLDEGAISVLDAARAGVPLLITPVGFHLDFVGLDSVSFFSTQIELRDKIMEHVSRYSALRKTIEVRNFEEYSNSLLNFFGNLD